MTGRPSLRLDNRARGDYARASNHNDGTPIIPSAFANGRSILPIAQLAVSNHTIAIGAIEAVSAFWCCFVQIASSYLPSRISKSRKVLFSLNNCAMHWGLGLCWILSILDTRSTCTSVSKNRGASTRDIYIYYLSPKNVSEE